MGAWYGVDFDGTLCTGTDWNIPGDEGKPIENIVNKVKELIANGNTVKVVTARYHDGSKSINHVKRWCLKYIGKELEVTASKDYEMIALYDDRAIQVQPDTGVIIEEELNKALEEIKRLERIIENYEDNALERDTLGE